jgi:hypothetical protein
VLLLGRQGHHPQQRGRRAERRRRQRRPLDGGSRAVPRPPRLPPSSSTHTRT